MKLLYLIFLFGLISPLKDFLVIPPEIEEKRNELILHIKSNLLLNYPEYKKLGDVSCSEGDLLSSFVAVKDAADELQEYQFPKQVEEYILSAANSTTNILLNYNKDNDYIYKHSIVAASKVVSSKGEYIAFVVFNGEALIMKKVQEYIQKKVECQDIPDCEGPNCRECKMVEYLDTRDLLPYEMRTLYTAADVCINKQMEKKMEAY